MNSWSNSMFCPLAFSFTSVTVFQDLLPLYMGSQNLFSRSPDLFLRSCRKMTSRYAYSGWWHHENMHSPKLYTGKVHLTFYFIYTFFERIFFIQQGCSWAIATVKMTIKTLQKIYISNKWCSFELSIHQRILEKKCIMVSKKNVKQQKKKSTLIIRNVSWAQGANRW